MSIICKCNNHHINKKTKTLSILLLSAQLNFVNITTACQRSMSYICSREPICFKIIFHFKNSQSHLPAAAARGKVSGQQGPVGAPTCRYVPISFLALCKALYQLVLCFYRTKNRAKETCTKLNQQDNEKLNYSFDFVLS